MNHATLADWLTAGGTVIAALLAVGLAGRDIIDRLIHHPTLDVALKHGPPDCVIVLATVILRSSDGLTERTHPAFFCRLAIENHGNRRADHVGVRMTRLYRHEADGSYRLDADFSPMNLKWTHTGVIETPVLEADLPRLCDFCFFFSPGLPGYPTLL